MGRIDPVSHEKYAITSLSVTTQTGRLIPNRFYKHNEPAKQLAIIFPGMRYTCDKPLLYYTTLLLLKSNCDVLQIWSDYASPEYEKLSGSELGMTLLSEATDVVNRLIGQENSQQVILVGKSIGTLTMALLLAQTQPPNLSSTIWFTPLLNIPWVVEAIRNIQLPAFIAGSPADRTFDLEIIKSLEKPWITSLVIPDANHSLELPDDPIGSLKIINEIVDRLAVFVIG
jgi:hypothetical protein